MAKLTQAFPNDLDQIRQVGYLQHVLDLQVPAELMYSCHYRKRILITTN